MPSIRLTSVPGGSGLPVTFGHAFKKGDVPLGSVVRVGEQTTQCDVRNRWSDGSAKICAISTLTTLAAGVETECPLNVISYAFAPALTEADLISAMSGKSFTVQCGSIGTVSLSDLIGTAALFDTFVSGPTMSEFRYVTAINSHLRVFFDVRVYSNGAVWAWATIRNGNILVAGATNYAYTLTITANGSTLYTGSVDQKHHTDITWPAWLSADPQITPRHDVAYLQETKLVPNYGNFGTANSALWTALVQTYTPTGRGNLTADMSGYGAADGIGLLPRWDAAYLMFGGDVRAYASVLANARHGGSFNVQFVDENTLLPFKFSDRPNLWYESGDANSVASWTGGNLYYADVAHQPSVGYLAYLLTGHRYHMEQVQYWACYCFIRNTYTIREGVKGILHQWGSRGIAWAYRTYSQAAVVSPDGSAHQTEFANVARNNVERWHDYYVSASLTNRMFKPNALGFMLPGNNDYDANNGIWTDAPWMQGFLGSALGYTYDLEIPLHSSGTRAEHMEVAQFSYKHVVGIVGSSASRPYPRASAYAMSYGTTEGSNESVGPMNYFESWADQWAFDKTRYAYGDVSGDAGQLLLGDSGGGPGADPPGYWHNLFPHLQYAVQHEAPGAAEAKARLESASNYSAVTTGFRKYPQFGLMARTLEAALPVLRTYSAPSGVTMYCGRTAYVPPGDFPAWRQGLTPFQAYSFPSSLLSAAPGYTNGSGITAFSGGTRQRAGSILHLGMGGGHADGWGNSCWAFAAGRETPAWIAIVPTNSNVSDRTSNTSHYLDGKPSARHCYRDIHYIDQTNRLMFIGCSVPWGDGNFSSSNVDAANPADGTWAPANSYTECVSAGPDSAKARDAAGNVWYFGPPSRIWRWSPSATPDGMPGTNTNVRASSYNHGIPHCVYEPFKIMVCCGNASTSARFYNVDEASPNVGVRTDVTLAGDAAAITEIRAANGSTAAIGAGEMVYDEGNDCLWFWRSYDVGTLPQLYRIDVTGTATSPVFTVSKQTVTGTVLNSNYNDLWGRFCYMPEIRGFVIVHAHNLAVQFIPTE